MEGEYHKNISLGRFQNKISLHLLSKLPGNFRKKYPSDLECQATSISERTSDAPGGE